MFLYSLNKKSQTGFQLSKRRQLEKEIMDLFHPASKLHPYFAQKDEIISYDKLDWSKEASFLDSQKNDKKKYQHIMTFDEGDEQTSYRDKTFQSKLLFDEKDEEDQIMQQKLKSTRKYRKIRDPIGIDEDDCQTERQGDVLDKLYDAFKKEFATKGYFDLDNIPIVPTVSYKDYFPRSFKLMLNVHLALGLLKREENSNKYFKTNQFSLYRQSNEKQIKLAIRIYEISRQLKTEISGAKISSKLTKNKKRRTVMTVTFYEIFHLFKLMGILVPNGKLVDFSSHLETLNAQKIE
jgi:hypothetical protein